MPFESVLRRTTTVREPAEFEKRCSALRERTLPYLERQQGFVSHEVSRDGDSGGMVEVTVWRNEEDCRAYLRNGAAAMSATWLDAFLPTAPFPNGNWLRESAARA